jgi:hypothetical protein
MYTYTPFHEIILGTELLGSGLESVEAYTTEKYGAE